MSVKSVICYEGTYLFDNKTCVLTCPSRYFYYFFLIIHIQALMHIPQELNGNKTGLCAENCLTGYA